VSSPVPGPSGVPAGCPSVVLPTNTNSNGTDAVNGSDPTLVGDGTDDPMIFDNGNGSDPDSTTNVNSTTDGSSTNDGQGETWGEWGTNIGNVRSF
jgi:hypothetical protein